MAKPATKPKADAPAAQSKSSKPGDNSVSPDQLKSFYRDMLLIRRFEEKAGQLYGMGLIGGFCHLYIGQEAVVVGMQTALVDGDEVITSYRDHGHMLATGMDPQGVMAELTGRARRLLARARAARCTCSARRRTSSAATASSARRCRSAPASPSATGIAATDRLADLFRRGRVQPGPGVRELQPGRADEAAGRLRHREQPIRHGHQRRARLGVTELYQARRAVGHSRRAGRRHGRAGGEGGRRAGGRALPRRQGPVPAGDADLSLSRPFDVATRPSTGPARRSRRCAREHDPIDHVAQAEARRQDDRRGAAQGDRRRGEGIVQDAADFAQSSPEPDPSELWTDVLWRAERCRRRS